MRGRLQRSDSPSSEFDQRHDQKIHGQDPDKKHLPEPEVAGAIVISGHLRIAVEEPFPDPKDVKAAEEDDRKENAEDDAQRKNGVPVFVDNREGRDPIHIK